MELVLIRGIPGSGKSTIARSMHGYSHFEADQFFMRDGEYKFDPSKISQAHQQCISNSNAALMNGNDCVVSNTFTRHWEMKPYIEMAKKIGASVRIIVATGRYKNCHGVPEEAIQRMLDRWED